MSDTSKSPWRDEGLAAFARDDNDDGTEHGSRARGDRGALADFQPEVTREPPSRRRVRPSSDATPPAPAAVRTAALRALPPRGPAIPREARRRVVELGVVLLCAIALFLSVLLLR
ncbi:MAG: hypothetical protein ABR606_12955 [Vicinamibacterales bacterium]